MANLQHMEIFPHLTIFPSFEWLSTFVQTTEISENIQSLLRLLFNKSFPLLFLLLSLQTVIISIEIVLILIYYPYKSYLRLLPYYYQRWLFTFVNNNFVRNYFINFIIRFDFFGLATQPKKKTVKILPKTQKKRKKDVKQLSGEWDLFFGLASPLGSRDKIRLSEGNRKKTLVTKPTLSRMSKKLKKDILI